MKNRMFGGISALALTLDIVGGDAFTHQSQAADKMSGSVMQECANACSDYRYQSLKLFSIRPTNQISRRRRPFKTWRFASTLEITKLQSSIWISISGFC